MESGKIEILLEKYFEGETTIAEEKELTNYFSSSDVAQHLEQYKPLFGYFSTAKEQLFSQEITPLSKPDIKRNRTWLSIAASVVVLLGAGTFTYFNYDNKASKQDLGTYDDPEVAFRETQKALSLLSQNVNVGVESMEHIQEYQNSKNLIFKK